MDVFYELPWRNPWYRYPRELFWSELQAQHQDQMYSSRVSHGKRIHYADVRFDPLLSYMLTPFVRGGGPIMSAFPYEFLTAITSPTKLLQLLDVFVTQDDAPDRLTRLFASVKKYDMLHDRLVGYRWSKYQKHTGIHKIRKQVLKLSAADADAVLRYYAAAKKALVAGVTAKAWRQEARAVRETGRNTRMLFWAALSAGVLLMDVYLLARLLLYLRRKDTQDVVVVAGDAHIQNYRWFFDNFLHHDALSSQTLHQADINAAGDARRIDRCAPAPPESRVQPA